VPTPVCRGECKRTAADPVHDSPARLVEVRPGRKVLACDCCSGVLRYVEEMAGPQGTMPAGVMDPSAMTSSARLYKDDTCGYDVRLLKDIRPAP